MNINCINCKVKISFYMASFSVADKVSRAMYFTINMTFAHQLQKNFPLAIQLEEFTLNITDTDF